jgi:hypothetical protein
MTIVNPSHRQAIDTEAPHDLASAHRRSSVRLRWGPGPSVALSIAFFLVALAISASLDVGHHFRSTHTATTDTLAVASTVGVTDVTDNSDTPAQSSDPAIALLARAHDCAAAGKWSCVIETTNNVNSLHGDTPETRALLEEAVIKGGWTPGQAAPRSPRDDMHHAQTAQAFPARTPQAARHGRRFPMRTRLTTTPPPETLPTTGGQDLAGLYRH